jgi:formamidopyrimidine-DNA glycosylase
MPELPEVEHVARQLRQELIGRRITSVRVLWDRAILYAKPADFAARVEGRTVVQIGRRGKFLLIGLEGGDTLVIHRRMSGNLFFVSQDASDPYARVEFGLDDGRRLLYSDPRKFGRLMLATVNELPALFAQLGPEPLDPSFTATVLAEQLAWRRGPIKALLLDQSVVAGLGNIYAVEALFRARIHPLRPGASLDGAEVERLRDAIQNVLRTGIEHGGTTFGRHRGVYNEAGRNLDHLAVYRRTGQPCPNCSTPIARITVAQRGTHFCPHCQPNPSP